MELNINTSQYMFPEDDGMYAILKKIADDGKLFKNRIQTIDAVQKEASDSKLLYRLNELSRFSDILNKIFNIQGEALLSQSNSSKDDRLRLAEDFAVYCRLMRMPFRHEFPFELVKNTDFIAGDNIRVYPLQGNEILEYIEMLPFSIIESDVEYGGINYYGYEENGQRLGIAVVIPDIDTAFLRYIFISDGYRGFGRGRHFLAEIIRLLYTQVRELSAEIVPEQKDYLYSLFCSFGFAGKRNGCVRYLFSPRNIRVDKRLLSTKTDKVFPLSMVSRRQVYELWRRIELRGMDFVQAPFSEASYDKELSGIYMDKEKPEGILLSEIDGDTVWVKYLMSSDKNPVVILQLIAFFAKKILKISQHKNIMVSFDIVEPKLDGVIENLLGISGNDQKTMTFQTADFLSDMEKAYELMMDFEGAAMLDMRD